MAERISAKSIHQELLQLGDATIAAHSSRFFKAGPGEYGEGDRFHGVRVPVLRSLVKKYRNASLRTTLSLQKSKWHEERLLAVLLLVDKYKRGSPEPKDAVYAAYLQHRSFINNWDIVDSSAHLIVGPHLATRSREPLFELARSEGLWDRRIAMMATYHFIRNNEFTDALKIARILRDDHHDLIHKVVGWMLREIGKRDRDIEEAYLQKHYNKMPRTMLRYAIEKFPPTLRKAYLNGVI